MSEISWYVLPELKLCLAKLKNFARAKSSETYLAHILAIYPEGVQKYGNSYFTNNQEILNFFDQTYLESGVISSTWNGEKSTGSFFLAKVS